MSLACRHCYSPRGGSAALEATHPSIPRCSPSSSSSSSSSYSSDVDDDEDDGLFDFLDAVENNSVPQQQIARPTTSSDAACPAAPDAPQPKDPTQLDGTPPETYLSMFLYGRQDDLDKNMSMVERQRPIPGVTVWCDRCECVSIISHTFFTHLRQEVDNRREKFSSRDRNDYYTRMCMQAEQLLRCQLSCIAPEAARGT
jgi:hypothetical protein